MLNTSVLKAKQIINEDLHLKKEMNKTKLMDNFSDPVE